MSPRIRTAADLDRTAAIGQAALYPDHLKILVGSASCGVAVGAREVEAAALRSVEMLGLEATVARTGCIGLCAREPLLHLVLPGGPRVGYADMTPEKTRDLLSSYASGGDLRLETAMGRFAREENVSTGEVHEYPCSAELAAELEEVPEWSNLDFYRPQKKVILRNCGSIDPRALDEAITRGAYRGALRALTRMTPDEVIDEISRSGLRGLGGAAFPTGQKWRLARQAKGEAKYVICNADEGEPGAYADRSVLEGDPHAILEGLIIGSYAVGAAEGFVYVRNEYPLALETLQHAVAEAERHGLLGDDLFGSGWSFRVEVRCGAGAYVCGEETALIESLAGRAGEPRNRPPYPVVEGLQGKPTVVNNVKTWAGVAPILTRGADWYQALGVPGSPGTTVFSLEGAVKNKGLVEVPFGTTLGEIVFQIGGGPAGDRPLKAVQAGGPAKGCIPASMLHDPGLVAAADGLGTGGIIVLDDRACMVDMARFLVDFFAEESCGKCTPCREGTRQMLRLLTRICEGGATPDDLAILERLAGTVKSASLCGLGSMAPGPVLTALRHFREEFQMHVREKKCPAGVCRFRSARPLVEPLVGGR